MPEISLKGTFELAEYIHVDFNELKTVCTEILKAEKFPEEKAAEIVDVLVEADARNIPSHGIARLERYIKERNAGFIDCFSEPETIFETPISAIVDGKDGPGQCVSKKSMELVIEKASKNMIGLISVRNSNHYGITAYYSEMALKNDMMGIAMTNSYPLVVPTYGKESVLGTNPISIAIPGKTHPFLLDMATSVITRGKLEVYNRLEKEIPDGWAIDEKGKSTESPSHVIKNFNERNFGGILPLGGLGEDFSGHKGFGLSVLVDLLTAGFSLGQFSAETYTTNNAGVCHFFGAIDLKTFGNVEEIKNKVDQIINSIVNSEKADGQEKIYYHGEKEYEARKESLKNGMKILKNTFDKIKKLASDNHITMGQQ